MIPDDNRILYYKRDRNLFRFLSHFYAAPIVIEGITWATAEHYYQAQKSFDPFYRQTVREAVSPRRAKEFATIPTALRRGSKRSWFRRGMATPRPDWNEAKLGIMRVADTAKFTQHAELAALLLATNDAELIEDSPSDPFWGIGPDSKGENWAGRILMEIRQSLAAIRTAPDLHR